MKIKKKCSWGHYYTREPQTRAPDESGLTFELWHGAKKNKYKNYLPTKYGKTNHLLTQSLLK